MNRACKIRSRNLRERSYDCHYHYRAIRGNYRGQQAKSKTVEHSFDDVDNRADAVDYISVIPFKRRLLETAWTNFKAGEPRDKDLRPAYDEFCARQAHWLEDYALFRALKEKYRASRCG